MSEHRTPYKDDLFNKLDMSWKNNANQLLDNQLLTPSGKIITFNDQQYEGINKIRAWLKEKNKPYIVLIGPAGTGKSTIIKKILDEYRGGVVVSAPTHRAKKVIADTTGKNSKTLHSLLGLRMDVSLEDFSPNLPIFNPIAEPQIANYNLICVDEVSMVNIGLLNLIKEKNKYCKTKILFIGDIFQIPPINEERSEVFFDDEIEKI
jgi:ATP-dependent exoDNAse (exonuclease V) alpha subunit